MVGTNVGAEVFHIGSPSDQTGSDFQSVRSRSTHSLSHPTTSPVSFGPIGSPSVSGSLIPEGAVSSPGLMSDVGSAGASFCAGVQPSSSGGRIQSLPGLPLSDPPRVTGAYGVPAYDPDFGMSVRRSDTVSHPQITAQNYSLTLPRPQQNWLGKSKHAKRKRCWFLSSTSLPHTLKWCTTIRYRSQKMLKVR